ncbi:MAG: response regulator transcription factor, partial [Candidatus Dormibacteria bacterium]
MADIRVLIVDDISSTLDNLKKLLSFEDDIEVIATATNGREAIEAAKRHGPDLVLMDVNMPEMDGIQATEVLATEAPNSPVIIMSVQGERDYLRRAMQSGAREFLIKPFSGD